MKRFRVIALILLLTASHVYAQPRLRVPEIYFGVHGGVTASSIMFQPAVENMRPITQACVLGGNGGFVFRYAGHKYCAVQVELNYMHRGWAEKSDAGRYSRELHYIEMPVLMNINFGSRLCRGFFNLGPQIGYCLYDNKGTGTQLSTITTQYATPITHPFDWGLAAGLGFYLRTRKAGLYQLEARFSYSFGGIFGTSLTDHFNMASPMDLSLNLAWLWEFKKTRKHKNSIYNENKL
ncbi:MAG: PorT family protein [Paludibacteraceae bacterium]|nr:PorT family protein [Paludibacteraceae bacterium]